MPPCCSPHRHAHVPHDPLHLPPLPHYGPSRNTHLQCHRSLAKNVERLFYLMPHPIYYTTAHRLPHFNSPYPHKKNTASRQVLRSNAAVRATVFPFCPSIARALALFLSRSPVFHDANLRHHLISEKQQLSHGKDPPVAIPITVVPPSRDTVRLLRPSTSPNVVV